jgi:hypothetical protein
VVWRERLVEPKEVVAVVTRLDLREALVVDVVVGTFPV